MRSLYRRIRAFRPFLKGLTFAKNCRWQNVVFSDELRLSLGTHDGPRQVRRCNGDRPDIHEQKTVGVIVWRALTYGIWFATIHSSNLSKWSSTRPIDHQTINFL